MARSDGDEEPKDDSIIKEGKISFELFGIEFEIGVDWGQVIDEAEEITWEDVLEFYEFYYTWVIPVLPPEIPQPIDIPPIPIPAEPE